MKLLIEVSQRDNLYLDETDGIILPLEGYAVESTCFFSMEEIEDIVSQSKNLVFVKLNKNFMNEDIEGLKKVLSTTIIISLLNSLVIFTTSGISTTVNDGFVAVSK